MSDLTAALFRQINPRIQTGAGFHKAMLAIWLETEGDDADSRKEWRSDHRPRFLPDAFLISHKAREVRVYEIEDSHPISAKKLADLIDFYFSLDAISWQFRVFVTDRYGQSARELSLLGYYAAQLACRPVNQFNQ